jgi:phosphoribosylaminoimidazolecarboxamide formyltransferase/IMP cyclohydrolase
MVRSAAKNHDFVAIVTDPADYACGAGETTLAQRRKFAAKAYALTASYDGAISQWFATADQGETFPETLAITGERATELRYGENPHQKAALYCPRRRRPRASPMPCRCRARS